jgi:hypothetical protein
MKTIDSNIDNSIPPSIDPGKTAPTSLPQVLSQSGDSPFTQINTDPERKNWIDIPSDTEPTDIISDTVSMSARNYCCHCLPKQRGLFKSNPVPEDIEKKFFVLNAGPGSVVINIGTHESSPRNHDNNHSGPMAAATTASTSLRQVPPLSGNPPITKFNAVPTNLVSTEAGDILLSGNEGFQGNLNPSDRDPRLRYKKKHVSIDDNGVKKYGFINDNGEIRTVVIPTLIRSQKRELGGKDFE